MYLEIPCPLVKTDRFVHVNLLLGTGNRFQHKSFRYELKQWNCTKISFTSSIVCWWTRKTFWVNTSSFLKYVELFTPIETNGNPWESTLIGNLLLFICPRFLRRCRGRSSSLSSVTTQNNSWYATISWKTHDMMETHDENDVRRYPERGSLNQRQINARAGKVLAGKWTRTRLRRFRKPAPVNQ